MKKKILICDDILIQLAWELAAEKEDYQLICFNSVNEFIAASAQFPTHSEIHLRAKLEDNPKRQISQLGFVNISSELERADLP